MIAKFTRGTDDRLGIRFEPETFEEQLLLEMFTRNAEALGHEFRFSGWEHNNIGRSMREGLTSCWGQVVAREVTCECGARLEAGRLEAGRCANASHEQDVTTLQVARARTALRDAEEAMVAAATTVGEAAEVRRAAAAAIERVPQAVAEARGTLQPRTPGLGDLWRRD